MSARLFYEQVGGREWFADLVDRFYQGVAGDPVLRPMYPDDLTASRNHLVAFLVQVCEGPAEYAQTRGHPRLRQRHAPFAIGAAARDAWLRHMAAAVREGGLAPGAEADLLRYFTGIADRMMNRS